jgi:hypothetical protein
MVMVVGNHARTPRGRGQMRWRCDVTLDNAFTTTPNGDHGFEGRRVEGVRDWRRTEGRE